MCVALRRDDLLTVAVLLTPRYDGRRDWDTSVAAITGPVKIRTDELTNLRELWPSPATDPLRTRASSNPTTIRVNRGRLVHYADARAGLR